MPNCRAVTHITCRPGFSDAATSSGDGKGAAFLDAFALFRDEVSAVP